MVRLPIRPTSSWPGGRHEAWYYCVLCGGEKYDTVELRFDSGSVEPQTDETLTGATSGDTGVVTEVVLESGSYAGGDAAGVVVMDSATGADSDGVCFSDNELVNGSVGGSNIFTANLDGIVKSQGLPYLEGETVVYNGKRYCLEHYRFVSGPDNMKYDLQITGENG